MRDSQSKEKILEELIKIKQFFSGKEIEALNELIHHDFLKVMEKLAADPVIQKDQAVIRQIFWFVCNLTFLDSSKKIDYHFLIHFSLEYINSPFEDISKMVKKKIKK